MLLLLLLLLDQNFAAQTFTFTLAQTFLTVNFTKAKDSSALILKILDGDFNTAFTMVGIKVRAKGEGQEEDLNFALILVISPVEPAPLDRALGIEGDEPHSLRKLCK